MIEQEEHFKNCPCGSCQVIRKETRDQHWASLSLRDRVQESLNAKAEGNGGILPERAMLNCADIQALLDIVRNQP